MNNPSSNIVWHQHFVTQQDRAKQKHQTPCIIWFTGLSGSGKSTLANQLERTLFDSGKHCYLLDGDNVRHRLNKDLGFGEADRIENIRRVGEVANLMCDAGLIVITAFISPFQADRELVRNMARPGHFLEVFIDTPLEVCEQRDPKGLYQKARAGEIANFTGIDSPYETPRAPDIHIHNHDVSIEIVTLQLVDALTEKGIL
ncbi:adenylyl-sulfate kinase [Hydrogenovibrio sp. SC-1]|uniref:adenylyl-sulfate kinase n=1 Tax=Hydrogenovibrio sp. SC-1 TaxID=2065820 RepID=UPI000C7E5040|nr:adenylyl-sulfate kinase [Hydrogenovibrio sp. SC-1]PLA75528.1 adenylyl-sulfate kinase [Hydrogenovibrio sp. SC-1]